MLLPAPPALAQTRDEFSYWDANGNGDLTCSEAEGRDEGLRLPAYQDDRDGTGIIYEWLQRGRSSDTDNDGIACDSASNPNGYIPTVEPVGPQGCPADAETWRGLRVCEERPRDGYDRSAFGQGYSTLEDDIIAALPPTMKAGGQVYTPYSCIAFDITPAGTAATDIEQIVALAEAHDSGIADGRRRDIASDLDNLTIADPTVNRAEKSDRDAAEWMPARHGAWFAERVIAVKLEYGLSVDPAERAALAVLLAGGGAELNCVDADTTPPTVTISTTATAPVNRPFPITVTFSESVTGFDLDDLIVGNGRASELQGSDANYAATVTPAASGPVTVDIPAAAAQDTAGKPSVAAAPFSIIADLTPVHFTDDPIRPGVTPVKAIHFTELRMRIDVLRRAAGLAPFPWTVAALTPGMTSVRRAHLLELRGGAGRGILGNGRGGTGMDRRSGRDRGDPDQGGAPDGTTASVASARRPADSRGAPCAAPEPSPPSSVPLLHPAFFLVIPSLVAGTGRPRPVLLRVASIPKSAGAWHVTGLRGEAGEGARAHAPAVARHAVTRKCLRPTLQEAAGLSAPVPAVETTVATTFKLPVSTVRAIRAYARRSGLSLGQVVTQAVTALLDTIRQRRG